MVSTSGFLQYSKTATRCFHDDTYFSSIRYFANIEL